jgi:hypothetical protein
MIEDFRRQFFPNAEPHTLTLEITSDDWAALWQIIEENDWERDEGLRYILAAGKAYVQTNAEMARLVLQPHPAFGCPHPPTPSPTQAEGRGSKRRSPSRIVGEGFRMGVNLRL